MRTIRTKVYNFEELVVDAQQNAIEQIRYSDNGFMDGYDGGYARCSVRIVIRRHVRENPLGGPSSVT